MTSLRNKTFKMDQSNLSRITDYNDDDEKSKIKDESIEMFNGYQEQSQ